MQFSENQKMVLVFNKFTGAYIGMTSGIGHERNEVNFKYREVELDPATQIWEGDYDSGSVVMSQNATVVISETELDADCQDKIFREYKYYHQLNVIYGVLDKLLQAASLSDSDYEVMKTYIASIVANNERYKEAYAAQEGYTYLDKQAERDLLNAQLEGGLHEIMGRDMHPGVPQ